jgi:F-type H+-transporting ATPase subunit delta
MGSATREALAASRAALADAGKPTLAGAEELLAAGRAIGGSAQLRGLLADPELAVERKSALVETIFGKSLKAQAKGLLLGLVAQRWSDSEDLLAGIEEIGIRAAAEAAPARTAVDVELFAFLQAATTDAELELALGSKLGDDSAKAGIVTALLEGKAHATTIAILRHLVQQPRGRRVRPLIEAAADIVADQAGSEVATVTAAAPLSPAQRKRLEDGLTASRGRSFRVQVVVDPSIIGGLRVRIGDEVVDGTVASRLQDLKLALAS